MPRKGNLANPKRGSRKVNWTNCLTSNEAEADAYGTKNATAEQVALKFHARKQRSGRLLDIVPLETPTEVVEHSLSEERRSCDACGAVIEEIGKEGTPESKDGTSPVLDPGGCALHLCL